MSRDIPSYFGAQALLTNSQISAKRRLPHGHSSLEGELTKKDTVDVCGPFALCMKKLRTERKMTQGDIVRATGLERGYVSNLESGKIKHPRMATVARIANSFEMKLSEFIAYIEEQFPEFTSSSRPK